MYGWFSVGSVERIRAGCDLADLERLADARFGCGVGLRVRERRSRKLAKHSEVPVTT
jgi:hypothetical protein